MNKKAPVRSEPTWKEALDRVLRAIEGEAPGPFSFAMRRSLPAHAVPEHYRAVISFGEGA